MSAGADNFAATRWPRWATWLRSELAYTPGRDLATARIVLTVALVTIISMTLQVPEAATSAYMVVFVTKENRVVTTLAGVLTILAITTGIIVSFLIYRYTFDYPVLRVPSMAAALFAGMFLSRVFVIGPLGFGIGFVVTLTQSASDGIPNAELLVRALLWIWVALVYPIALTVIVNQFLFPAEPWAAFTRALGRRLDLPLRVLRQATDEGRVGGRDDPDSLEMATRGSAPLLKLLHFAEARNPRLKKRHASLVAAVRATERLAGAAAAMSLGEPRAVIEDDRLCARRLEVWIAALRSALASPELILDTDELMRSTATLPELRELQMAAVTLSDSLTQKQVAGSIVEPGQKSPKKSLFVPDAFTNPAHVHFALKVTLAAMSCYVLYSGLDWPGIHTALITCCIIALESAGATRRKGWLRLAGCTIGGLLAFSSIMYLVPQMESIVSLVLLVSAVTALAGWVAMGSERIAYGGLQIALAFYLGIFQDYAPGTDFDKIRDRLMGIILGITVSSVIFRFVWPERAGDKLRAAVGRLLRALVDFVRVPTPGRTRSAMTAEVDRLLGRISGDLDDAMQLTDVASLEEGVSLHSEQRPTSALRDLVGHAQAIFLINNTLTTTRALDEWTLSPVAARNVETVLRDDVAIRLSRVADDLVRVHSPRAPKTEYNAIAIIDSLTQMEMAEGGRAYLLRRLVEQAQQCEL